MRQTYNPRAWEKKTNFGVLRRIAMPEHEKTCIMLSITALKVYEHTKQNVTSVEAQWHELGISEFQKMIDNIDETAKEVMIYPPNRAINKMKMAPATCFTLVKNTITLTQYNDNEIVIEDCYNRIKIFCDQYTPQQSEDYIAVLKSVEVPVSELLSIVYQPGAVFLKAEVMKSNAPSAHRVSMLYPLQTTSTSIDHRHLPRMMRKSRRVRQC